MSSVLKGGLYLGVGLDFCVFFLKLPCSPLVEKEIATHSSIFAWRIPWTEEPGGLQSMGRKVKHDLTEQQQQQMILGTGTISVLVQIPISLFL